MKNKTTIILIIIITTLLAIGAFLFAEKNQKIEFSENPTFTSEKQMQRYYKKLEEAYKQDTYGGKTPEETIKLFVDALKAGDIELASKYFVVEKQGEMLEQFKAAKNKSLDLLINDLEKNKTGVNMGNKYRFRTYDDNGVAEFSFDLIFNESTKIWKIESL